MQHILKINCSTGSTNKREGGSVSLCCCCCLCEKSWGKKCAFPSVFLSAAGTELCDFSVNYPAEPPSLRVCVCVRAPRTQHAPWVWFGEAQAQKGSSSSWESPLRVKDLEVTQDKLVKFNTHQWRMYCMWRNEQNRKANSILQECLNICY